MTQEFVISIGQSALYTVLLVSAPILGLALIVGLMIGIFQAVTSINEMTLTFVPKIIVVMLAIAIFAPWILQILMAFTLEIFNAIPGIV